VIPFDNSILSINRTGTINSAQYANAITGGKEELPHARTNRRKFVCKVAKLLKSTGDPD
jgi:hypothetical protein